MKLMGILFFRKILFTFLSFSFLMVLNNYRDRFRFLIEGPANFCMKLNIGPNQLSFLAFLISIGGAITFAFPEQFMYNFYMLSSEWYLWWGWIPIVLFGLGSYIDVLDGTVARKTKKVSKYGGFLDSTLDRLSDGAIIMGLVFGNMLWPWEQDGIKINALIGLFALMIIILISYVRARAEVEGVVMKGVGFMERAERVLFIVLAYLIGWIIYCVQRQYYVNSILETSRWVFPLLFFVFLGLCIWTLLKRIFFTFHKLQDKNREEN